MSSAPRFSAASIASLPPSERLKLLSTLSAKSLRALTSSYDFWARASQREPPGDWDGWLKMDGRGAGKTWTGANVTNRRARSGRHPKILLAAATPGDARDTMIEGESGILATAPSDFRPVYEPSKLRITWPNGCRGYVRSGAEPDRFRGLNTSYAWLDELAAWQYPQESFDNAMLGLRLGPHPQTVITTTPKPIALLRTLIKNPRWIVTSESTYANAANLSASFISRIRSQYEGTTLGQQEIYAHLLTEVPGALWRLSLIEATRMQPHDVRKEDLLRIVIAIDPAVTSGANSNETGIIAVAAGTGVRKGHAYVLRDESGRHSATHWPKLAVAMYHALSAERVVYEANQGGDLVAQAIRVVDPNVPLKAVTASRGKRTRAEPVAALYEQGRVHHVGPFPQLEDQMCTFVPDERAEADRAAHATGISVSPDRVDALVWGVTELLLGPRVFIA